MGSRSALNPIAVAACAVGAAALASLASHAIWRRSATATIFEWLAWASGRKRRYVSEKSALEDLAVHRKPDERTYRIPAWTRALMRAEVSVTVFRDAPVPLPVYTLRPPGTAHDSSDDGTVLLHLHGGAYDEQPLPFHWLMLDSVVRLSGATAVVPLYALAPDHCYRDAYAQLDALYARLLARVPPSRLVLGGDSAGGGLAGAFAEHLCAQGRAHEQARSLVLISPWVDLTLKNPEIEAVEGTDPLLAPRGASAIAEVWARGANLKDPLLSPIYGDVSQLQDVTVFTGTREILYPDCLGFVRRLQEAGVPVRLHEGEGMNHDYPIFPTVEGVRAVRQIAQILEGGFELEHPVKNRETPNALTNLGTAPPRMRRVGFARNRSKPIDWDAFDAMDAEIAEDMEA